MKTHNDIALKEWAIVCQALEEGKQTLLLRKDGVVEENGVFRCEHPEFFLYPTFDHGNPENIKPDWRPRLNKLEKEAKDVKHIHVRLYAMAESAAKITDWEVAKRFIPFTVMNDPAVEKLFHEGGWEGLYLIIVRVFSLAVPMDLSKKPAHDASKGWVPLGTSLFTAGAFSVIPDGAWPYPRDKIQKMVTAD